jgi:hypothetical protein
VKMHTLLDCHRSLESAPRAVTSKCTTAEVRMSRAMRG